MPLISMRRTPEEADEYAQPVAGDVPAYPYGLQICLCDDELEKLELGMMPVGTVLRLMALVEVTGTRETATEGGEDRSVDLQITAMSLEPGQPQDGGSRMAGDGPGVRNLASSLASRLYGG